MTEQEFLPLAEAGELKLKPDPSEIHVDLRKERVTIRFFYGRRNARDRLGIGSSRMGRSSVIQMSARESLEQVHDRPHAQRVRIMACREACMKRQLTVLLLRGGTATAALCTGFA